MVEIRQQLSLVGFRSCYTFTDQYGHIDACVSDAKNRQRESVVKRRWHYHKRAEYPRALNVHV